MNSKLSERGSAEVIVVLVIMSIVVFGMYTVAHVNGTDIFTSFWSFIASIH